MDEPSARKIMAALGIVVLGRSSTNWLQARCPFAPWLHRGGYDRHPGFGVMINTESNSYFKCLACGQKGRVSLLCTSLGHYREADYRGLALDADLADMRGLAGSWDTPHSIISMEDEDVVPVDEDVVSGAYPSAWGDSQAQSYLVGRGIGRGTADLLGLLYDPDEARILFPVRGRRGELYGYTSRSILRECDYPYNSYQKVKDYLGLPKRHLLLGEQLYQRGKPNLIVEGLFGLASLVEQGVREFCNPQAVMGNSMTVQKANRLNVQGSSIFLLADNDPGGDVFLWGPIDPVTGDHNDRGAVHMLQSRRELIYVPEWPNFDDGTPKDDPDQLSRDEVKFILDNCQPYTGR